MPKQPDVASLSYEEARDELIQVVARLEGGSPTLEESLSLWERGEALAARCQELLEGARDRVTRARDKDGSGDGARASGGALADDDADAGVIAVVRDDENAE